MNEGDIKNKNLYNDKELVYDADLDWYDYGFRSYDTQIGRFPQLDPLTDDYPELTPYQYASNDPITNIDIDGLEGGSAVGAFTRDFSYAYDATSATADFWKPLATAASTASTAGNGLKTAINLSVRIGLDGINTPLAQGKCSKTRDFFVLSSYNKKYNMNVNIKAIIGGMMLKKEIRQK